VDVKIMFFTLLNPTADGKSPITRRTSQVPTTNFYTCTGSVTPENLLTASIYAVNQYCLPLHPTRSAFSTM